MPKPSLLFSQLNLPGSIPLLNILFCLLLLPEFRFLYILFLNILHLLLKFSILINQICIRLYSTLLGHLSYLSDCLLLAGINDVEASCLF
jgi:hypothetical protein